MKMVQRLLGACAVVAISGVPHMTIAGGKTRVSMTMVGGKIVYQAQ
jgi:hypothetical protein